MARARRIVQLLLAATVLACGASSNESDPEMQDLIAGMDQAKEHHDRWAKEHVPALMSVEVMFPDSRARALALAAAAGRLDEVDRLIADGVAVNSRGVRNTTVLLWTVRDRNVAGFERLLQHGADPNLLFDDRTSVMHWIVESDDLELLRIALRHGGDPNLVGAPFECTLFHDSVLSSNDEVVDLLLEVGGDISAPDGSLGSTPTMTAVAVGRYRLALRLLELGADYTIETKRGQTLADNVEFSTRHAAKRGEPTEGLEEIAAWLRGRGALPRK